MNYEPIPGVPPSRNPTHRRYRENEGAWYRPLYSRAARYVTAETPTWRRTRKSSKRDALREKRAQARA